MTLFLFSYLIGMTRKRCLALRFEARGHSTRGMSLVSYPFAPFVHPTSRGRWMPSSFRCSHPRRSPHLRTHPVPRPSPSCIERHACIPPPPLLALCHVVVSWSALWDGSRLCVVGEGISFHEEDRGRVGRPTASHPKACESPTPNAARWRKPRPLRRQRRRTCRP